MKRFFVLGLGVVLCANASATLINFDDGVANSPVGSFYAGQGVTFTNATWLDASFAPGGAGLGIIHTDDLFWPQAGNPIGASFSSTMGVVSLRGLDVGENGYTLNAYDSSDNLVDSDSVTGATMFGIGEFYDLTVTGSISRIEFFQNQFIDHGDEGKDGIVFENLSFEPVPEPASMLALGAGALALLRRRRK